MLAGAVAVGLFGQRAMAAYTGVSSSPSTTDWSTAIWTGGTPTASSLVSLGGNITMSNTGSPIAYALVGSGSSGQTFVVGGNSPLTLVSEDATSNGTTTAAGIANTISGFILQINSAMVLGNADTSTSGTHTFYVNNSSGSRNIRLTGGITEYAGTTWGLSFVGTGVDTTTPSNTTAALMWTYHGDTTIGTGSDTAGIRVQASVLPHGIGFGNVILNTGATMQLTPNGGAVEINGLSGGGNITRTANRGNLVIGDGNATGFTFSGTFADNSSSTIVTKVGSGLQTFSGASSTYQNTTNVLGGTLAFAVAANSGTISSIGKGITTANTADILLDGGILSYVGATNGATGRKFVVGYNSGGLASNGAGLIDYNAVGYAVTSDVIMAVGLPTASNSITGLSTDSGITSGLAVVNYAGANQGGGVSSGATTTGAASGGSVTVSASVLPAAGVGVSLLQFVGATTPANRTFTLSGSNTDNTVVNNLGVSLSNAASGGKLAVVKSGANTWKLSGSNVYGGGTTVTGGTLVAGSTHAFSDSAAAVEVQTGGAIDLNGQTLTAGKAYVLKGGSLLNNSGTAASINTSASATVTDSGNYTTGAAPTVTISGATASALLGVKNITIVNGGSLGNNPVFSFDAPDLAGGVAPTVVPVLTSGVLTGLYVTNPGSGYTHVPVITLTGGTLVGFSVTVNAGVTGIAISNGGTGFTSAPTVTFSGGTGTATATAVGGISSVQLASNTTSTIGGAGNMTLAAPITGSGNLIKAGAGTTTLSGQNTYTGTTLIATPTSGTNTLALVGGSLANGKVAIQSGGAFTMDSASSIKFNIADKVTFDQMTETGTGTHTLAGGLVLDFGQTVDFATWQIMNLANGAADGFGSVTVTGAYAGLLTEATPGSWTGTLSGQDFSFDEATGIVSVPEPTSLALLGLVGGGLLARRRRQM